MGDFDSLTLFLWRRYFIVRQFILDTTVNIVVEARAAGVGYRLINQYVTSNRSLRHRIYLKAECEPSQEHGTRVIYQVPKYGEFARHINIQ